MSDLLIMLKNKRNIVSRLFDTINKMTEEDTSEAGTSEAGTSEAGTSEAGDIVDDKEAGLAENYTVSIPNKNTPLKFTTTKPIVLCVYRVRTDGLYPFILFLLQQKSNNFFALPYGGNRPKKIKYAAIAYLKTVMPNTFTYAGFYESTEQNILILTTNDQPQVDTSTEYIWATAFEIINKKQVLNDAVHSNVLTFFHANPAFLTLKTREQCLYESPMLGYYQADQATCTPEELDIYRETILPTLGKCYYLLMTLPADGTKILRIVFFAGKMVLYTGKKEIYDSLLCHKKYYIIQNYNQHVLVSVC